MSHNALLAVISLLAEKWPSCFSIIESGRRPLKLGIRDDVLAAPRPLASRFQTSCSR